MRTKTFFTPDAKFRLIVTRTGEFWNCEIRQANGVSIGRIGTNPDDVLGELFMIAQQRTGDTSKLAELFGQADEAIDNGEFAEVFINATH